MQARRLRHRPRHDLRRCTMDGRTADPRDAERRTASGGSYHRA